MSKSDNKFKRISIKTKNPNPLFEQWLKEWYDQAKEKGSDMQYCFAKALASLRKFPLVLKSGKECAILQNFGKKLCSMIDKKLAEYLQQHPEFDITKLGPSLTIDNHEATNVKDSGSTSREEHKEKNGKEKNSKKLISKYVPGYRTGAYAILIALYKKLKVESYSGYMTKAQLQTEAQPYCDRSLTRPEGSSNNHYTAWSSMAPLVRKGLISRSGCPAKFSLTEEGIAVARELKESVENDLEFFIPNPESQSPKEDDSDSMEIQTEEEISPCSQTEPTSSVMFPPLSFDIILLVDKQETIGGVRGQFHDQTISELSRLGIMFEVRHLKVGDFAWVCRPRRKGSLNNLELILPYIVERKRMDDLARSIKDGRFHEQKFRLKQCGLPRKIYLIESLGDANSDERAGLAPGALRQAAVNTQLVDGFLVRQTKGHRFSMYYLATFTKVLVSTYKNKTLTLCCKENIPALDLDLPEIKLMSFDEFNKSSSKIKNYTVRDMFIKHLVQLNGLSLEKALAIVEKYPTPQTLRNAFLLHPSPDSMLSEISYGKLGRSIGSVISKLLYELYMNRHLS